MKKGMALFAGAIVVALSCAQGSEPEGKIALVPSGEIDRELLKSLEQGLEEVFAVEIQTASGLEDLRFAYNSDRDQYHSTLILEKLTSLKGLESCDKVLGIVDVDLYVPELNFVFGEALGIGGRFAVISLTRLRQEFYGLKAEPELFRQRALKEAVHELGHLWGLGHCSRPECVMFFSNSLPDTDEKGWNFCPECRKRMQASVSE